eukprot:1506156-Amphidinium_carterae.1
MDSKISSKSGGDDHQGNCAALVANCMAPDDADHGEHAISACKELTLREPNRTHRSMNQPPLT